MPNSELRESESEEGNGKGDDFNMLEISSYERQRLDRIEEKKKRMEALGLKKMADSLMGAVQKSLRTNREKKGKNKMFDKDEEYNPTQEKDERSSSEDDEYDDEFSLYHKKKVKRNITSRKKKSGPEKKLRTDTDFLNDDGDDEVLKKAIALSLLDASVSIDTGSNSAPQLSEATNVHSVDSPSDKRNQSTRIKEDSGQMKRRKPQKRNRAQITEDELLIHFFQFDETGKGGINARDIQRLAKAQDFTWSQKEISDMISFFDCDGDGKLSFDEFRKIVVRCNMLKGSDE